MSVCLSVCLSVCMHEYWFTSLSEYCGILWQYRDKKKHEVETMTKFNRIRGSL